jgi:hypothetical protein
MPKMRLPRLNKVNSLHIIASLLVISIILNIILVGIVFTKENASSESDVKSASEISLVAAPITIEGNKELKIYTLPVIPTILEEKDTLTLTLNLNGLCVLPAKAAMVRFVTIENKEYEISLQKYVQNCARGDQTIHIPLVDIFGPSPFPQVTSLDLQFWYPTLFVVTVSDISIYNNVLAAQTKSSSKSKKPTPKPTAPLFTATPTIKPTPTTPLILTPTPSIVSGGWQIKSVSSMKETKDIVCTPRDITYIQAWINAAVELGVTHIAVETPYDSPSCGDAVAYTKLWVDAIHARGLHVWHRHMPLAFEGIYNTPKSSTTNYLTQISNYIKSDPTFFKSGDIFTPIPEPQNGGIAGITYCPQNICIFAGQSQFNTWLRDAIDVSQSAFTSVNISGMKIGYYGFDGFVAWGDNNPDWHGILEDATVAKMGNITIDHYPEIVGDTMENDLNELQARYPTTPIIIGEWGTITGGDTEAQVLQTMGAATRPNVIGFNYWHMGVGGNEALINSDFSKKAQFDEVQSFYLPR